jgi:hypothetical protein
MKKYVDRGIVKWAPFDSVIDSQNTTEEVDFNKEDLDWVYEKNPDDED